VLPPLHRIRGEATLPLEPANAAAAAVRPTRRGAHHDAAFWEQAVGEAVNDVRGFTISER
jgi:hypothetical protein